MLKVAFIGIHGSGKDTQADYLARGYGIKKVSTGDLLRTLADSRNPEGVRLRDEFWGKGMYVPDDQMLPILQKELARHEGFALAGFPRTLNQFDQLRKIASIDALIGLDVSEGEARMRMLRRGRPDDAIEIINKRNNVYAAETKPLWDNCANKPESRIGFRYQSIIIRSLEDGSYFLQVDGIGNPEEIYKFRIRPVLINLFPQYKLSKQSQHPAARIRL